MYQFSRTSETHLATCDTRLRLLAHWLINYIDFKVIEGHRSQADQERYFEEEKTRVKWGKHNTDPSKAFHLLPYPWPKSVSLDSREGILRMTHFAGVVRAAGAFLRIPIRWGGDWDGDFILSDNKFNDLLHFELGGE